jgi:hypothetical protein
MVYRAPRIATLFGKCGQISQTKFIWSCEKHAAPIESTKELAITDTEGLEHEASQPGCDCGSRDWGVAPKGTAVFQQRAPGSVTRKPPVWPPSLSKAVR